MPCKIMDYADLLKREIDKLAHLSIPIASKDSIGGFIRDLTIDGIYQAGSMPISLD